MRFIKTIVELLNTLPYFTGGEATNPPWLVFIFCFSYSYTMASNTGTESTNGSSSSKEAEKPLPIEPIRLPTAEEIRGQDIWNNCAVRSVVSGVMGMNQAPFFRFIFVIFANGFDSFSLFPFVWFPRKYEKAFFFGSIRLFFTYIFGISELLYFCPSVHIFSATQQMDIKIFVSNVGSVSSTCRWSCRRTRHFTKLILCLRCSFNLVPDIVSFRVG